MNSFSNRRILLIDDTPAIHNDFSKILTPKDDRHHDLETMECALFGDAPKFAEAEYELDSAYGGQEGLDKMLRAMDSGRPYALAFVDMRMPDGWDGARTIEELWKRDPLLQIVVCTAYADYAWDALLERLNGNDRLLILKKPFDNIEIQQMAKALTVKWEMTARARMQMHTLEGLIQERTQALEQTSVLLKTETEERKLLEMQLVQSEKLASLGQLAAGVAHEINNPIGFISSNLGALEGYFGNLFEMLKAYGLAAQAIGSPERLAQLEKLREKLELDFLLTDIPLLIKESKDGVYRVSQIVDNLKAFSRAESSLSWELTDLHNGVDSTLNIVANEIKYKADVVKQYAVLPLVECLPSQINQVIMNLIVNAGQAIGAERGTITLRTGINGETVWIEVADTGCGIPHDTLEKIFDPFFTTKPVGQGTGLGLSLSYGIVKKHNGTISVRSEAGVGTTFKVELPVRQTVQEPTP